LCADPRRPQVTCAFRCGDREVRVQNEQGRIRGLIPIKGWGGGTDYGYDPHAAGRLLMNEDAVRTADLPQIKAMLTYCVRGERFGEGHWAAMVEGGHGPTTARATCRTSIRKRLTGSRPVACRARVRRCADSSGRSVCSSPSPRPRVAHRCHACFLFAPAESPSPGLSLSVMNQRPARLMIVPDHSSPLDLRCADPPAQPRLVRDVRMLLVECLEGHDALEVDIVGRRIRGGVSG